MEKESVAAHDLAWGGCVRSAGRRGEGGATQIPLRNLSTALEFKGLQVVCFALIALQEATYLVDFKGNDCGLKIPRS